MSYRINVRKRLDGTVSWGLVFRSYSENKRADKRVKTTDLLQYGFRQDMSVEAAKERASQLNAETKPARSAEKRKVYALDGANKERALDSKHFPAALSEEFENNRLRNKFEFGGSNPTAKYKKAISRWRYARKMAIEIDMPIEDWYEQPRAFYSYFIENTISLDYAGKVLGVLNMWGMFVAKKQGRRFLPIAPPRGNDRQEIADAYDDSEKKKKESLPLTPDLLEGIRSRLKEPYYNWLYITLWFGLRPGEVGGKWKVEGEGNRTVLAVYQTKLTTIKKDSRWKRIPIKTPQQKKALAILIAGSFKRPPKSAMILFGDGYGLYAGRKGFTPLMKSLGQPFMSVSNWLGHLDPKTTKRYYDDLTATDWGNPLKKAG